jgi:ABC-type dipeptide/oligopeptide/nickel transport system permease component
MAIYLLRRLLISLALIAVSFVIVFFALRFASGGPTWNQNVVRRPAAERYQRDFGTSKPPVGQFLDFLAGLPRGDFGASARYRLPTFQVIRGVAPNTLLLGGVSLLSVMLLAGALGTLAAVQRGSWLDRAVLVVILFGQSAPTFWVGLMLALIFAVRLQIFPAVGYAGAASLVLPALTIAASELPWHVSVIRSEMIEALLQDYVRTAQACGIRRRRIHYLYALRNAAIPWLGVLAVRAGYLFGGTLVAEVVFNYPGLGKLFVEAVSSRDYALVQAISLVTAATFIGVSFMVDVVYAWADPRIRLQQAATPERRRDA